MTQKQVVVVGSLASGTCNAHATPQDWTGQVLSGVPLLTVTGQSISRVGDLGSCSCGHAFRISQASGSLLSTPPGVPVSVVGDAVEVVDGSGTVVGSGTIASGSPILTVDV